MLKMATKTTAKDLAVAEAFEIAEVRRNTHRGRPSARGLAFEGPLSLTAAATVRQASNPEVEHLWGMKPGTRFLLETADFRLYGFILAGGDPYDDDSQWWPIVMVEDACRKKAL